MEFEEDDDVDDDDDEDEVGATQSNVNRKGLSFAT